MAPRTLWTILLKIAGLFIFLQILNGLPRLFEASTYLLNENHDSVIMGMIAGSLFSISIYLFMLIAFVFRTDWLINVLRLNKGIAEEKLELNIHRSSVLQIATIVTGGLILVDSLPLLLKGLFNYYQQINVFNGFKRYPYSDLIIIHLVKVLIGFFMVTSNRLIVNFIERKRKGKVKTEVTPG
ncbi:MAG: hypothetical protein JWQ63_1242 [Mucilaginibacter sp.]|nr:hypothetical protein [Mucilaginibacter sp.]